MAALVDDKEDGTIAEEPEEAAGSSCICVWVDIGISINKFHYFLTKNTRL